MKFSIVIPLYNKGPYIMHTIESVLAQTLTDFEVVVVDDGSTDGGDALVAAIADPRLRLVRQANAGVSVARNRGIEEAQGEWVVFLDADDWHHPRFLASLVAAQQRHPEVDTVATQYMLVPESGDNCSPNWPELQDVPEVELITDFPGRWMQGPTVCTGSVAARTVLLEQMQPCFPPGESQAEDLDLWFRLAERTAVALVRAPLLAYRVELTESLTTNHVKLPESLFSLPSFLERMRTRAFSGAMSKKQRRSALHFIAQQNVDFARYAAISGKRLQGCLWLLRGFRAAMGKRWWLTVTMLLFWPGKLIANWEVWRSRQTFYPNQTSDAGR
jgi:cellulose synthase/poly-beta-1,6-N-acetylglucosamine synthase-like glycosyltransferase